MRGQGDVNDEHMADQMAISTTHHEVTDQSPVSALGWSVAIIVGAAIWAAIYALAT